MISIDPLIDYGPKDRDMRPYYEDVYDLCIFLDSGEKSQDDFDEWAWRKKGNAVSFTRDSKTPILSGSSWEKTLQILQIMIEAGQVSCRDVEGKIYYKEKT